MSQRDSGYERIPADAYMTPAWVTEALLPHLPRHRLCIWECASGTGQMARVLRKHHYVPATDISRKPSVDFLTTTALREGCTVVVTNPPYTHARAFIEHALDLTRPVQGLCAFLLRTDYDHAATRQHLFAREAAFAKKLVLTKRIQWFEHATSAPSFNHAWYIWDHDHQGPPTISYGPEQQ